MMTKAAVEKAAFAVESYTPFPKAEQARPSALAASPYILAGATLLALVCVMRPILRPHAPAPAPRSPVLPTLSEPSFHSEVEKSPQESLDTSLVRVDPAVVDSEPPISPQPVVPAKGPAMIERSAVSPHLGFLASSTGLFRSDTSDGEFRVLHLNLEEARTSAHFSAQYNPRGGVAASPMPALAVVAAARPVRAFRAAIGRQTGYVAVVAAVLPRPNASGSVATTNAGGAVTYVNAGPIFAGQSISAAGTQGKSQDNVNAYADVNTDAFANFDAWCQKSRATCSRGANGERVAKYANGMKMAQSYDQSKAFGSRNTFVYEMPNGTAQTVVSSPLVLDLKGKGVRASDRVIGYDLSGAGRRERLHDIGSGQGVLVFDANHDGIAGQNGRELFGDRTDLEGRGKPDGYKDGFEALAALVRKAEKEKVVPAGTLDGGRLGAKELAALGRAYGLGIRVGGLLKRTISLQKAGVIGVSLSQAPSVRDLNFDGQGDDVVRREGAFFTRADGTTGSYEDIFFEVQRPAFKLASLR